MKAVENILEELSNYIRLVKLGWLPEETLVQMIASVLDGEIDFPESLKLEVIEAYDKMERAEFVPKSQLADIPVGVPVVFISYSWDSESHKQWVRKLADDLQTKYGVFVLCDCYNRHGEELANFMVKAIERADRVLIIGTPNYKCRSGLDYGGAGFEGHIINVDIYHRWDTCKYVPLLREGGFDTSFPITIEARTGRDFSDDANYDENLRVLANDIKGVPENARPGLGVGGTDL